MWSELGRLVESQSHEAAQPGETRAASLIALYGALVNCQIAFERLEEGAAVDGQADAVLAMDVLLATLHNVQPALGLFEPSLARELARHVRSGRRPADASAPEKALRDRVKTLRRLLALETMHVHLDLDALSDFTGARRRLAEFVRHACASDELFAG